VEGKSKSSTLNALTEALTKLTTNQTEFVTETRRFMAETRTNFNNQAAAIRNLEIQVGQIAEKLNERAQGTWPSNTEINPKECMAVVTRSGKKTVDPEEVKEKPTSPQAAENSTSNPSRVVPVTETVIPPGYEKFATNLGVPEHQFRTQAEFP